MGELSPWHLLIVAAVFVLLFGARKLPDAARSLGQSMRIFKAETKGLRSDEAVAPPPPAVTQQPTQVIAQPAQPAQVVAQPAPPDQVTVNRQPLPDPAHPERP
jgi:sec-independent protein translocase protein TatA